ncbi:MAG: phospho-N-acetylmuramoyl-pentapeptide-transferase [Patescibacteria group bacterium]|nr:phospho-N-acetylmuramoyl-pentapeptide-transferase [Patescibacteria group bacterium]
MSPLLDLSVNDHVRNLLLIFGYGGIGFLLFVILTPSFTKFLLKNKLGKKIRDTAADGSPSPIFQSLHLHKAGTPTMAGILILGVILFLCAVTWVIAVWHPDWFSLDFMARLRGQIYLPLGTMILMAGLGAIDDYWNISNKKKSVGLAVKPQFFFLLLFASIGAWWFYSKLGWSSIHVPRVGDFDIGWLYVPLFVVTIMVTSKAVDVTDGLDGLSSGLLIAAFGAFGLIAYAKGMLLLAIFLGLTSGTLLGYLWFNLPPARFFMGTIGILPLGALLGIVAMLTNSVLVLPIIGFVFFLEFASSALQLFWKRVFKRKLFLIAPLHHHLEKRGWPAELVVMRFWIIGLGMAAVGAIIGLLGMGVTV